MKASHLPVYNLRHFPVRTAALLLLVALLAMSLFCGSIVITSLQNGLDSLNARLGADIICIPATARSKVNTDNLLLTGTTGYFYMKSGYLDTLAKIDGVEQISAQLFLASMRADCCSVAIQVIGIDQQTDFTVQPWIAQSYGTALGDCELAVGSRVTSGVGESIRIYGVNCPVVARLASTGTAMDTAVYCSMDTLRALLEAARDLGHNLQIDGDPEDVISAVYIRVSPDTTVEAVTNDINLHVRKVEAVSTRTMLSGISDSLDGVSGTVSLLIAAVWVLVFVVLILAFAMLAHERKKEFAVLRVMGMSRRMLAGTALVETMILSAAGGVLGAGMGALVVFPFSTLIETRLGLPYLTPDAAQIALYALLSLAAVLLIGPLSSAWAVFRLSHVDTGLILREAD